MGSEGIASSFLTSALDGGEWSASRPRACLDISLEKYIALTGTAAFEPRLLGCEAHNLVAVGTQLSRLKV
jgi:hypothetical protein